MKIAKIVLVLGGSAFVLGAPLARAEAPRGSSYADDPDALPPPVQTLTEETASDADLRVKRMPAKLKMRPKVVAQVTKPAPDATTDGSASVGYKMFPTTTRDLRERVTFRIRAGVALETAPASGDTLRGGFPLPDGYTDTRPWVVGDAIVGARGIIVPSLGGYFLSSFAFDASDSLATRAGQIHPSDAAGEALAIKAGYAEWGRDDRKPDDQQPNKVWLRGGRQFRLDGGNMFAYFDGLTIGYRDRSWNGSVFAGQRVVLYVDSEAGLTYGATAALDLKPLKNIPVKVGVDFLGLTIDVPDGFDPTQKVTENRQLITFHSTAKLSKKLKLDARARLTGLPDREFVPMAAGDQAANKIALGRLGGRIRYEADRLIVIADVEQRTQDDVAYDLATPSAVDIVQVAEKLGVGLSQPVDAIRAGIRVDWQNAKKNGELLLFGSTEQPIGDTPINVDQKAYFEGGVALAGSPIGSRGSGVYTTAQYTYRQYVDEGADGDMRLDGVGSFFGNSASSGIDRMHQLAAEASLATKGSGTSRYRFSAGGFFRVYDFRTPYREVTNDARGGGRADLKWWFSRDLHLDVAAEVAQASPTLSRDIGLMTSLRAMVEARW